MSVLEVLPEAQRQALILIGASGFSYQGSADIPGVKTRTVKSRVPRARFRLEALMGEQKTFERCELVAEETAALIQNALLVQP